MKYDNVKWRQMASPGYWLFPHEETDWDAQRDATLDKLTLNGPCIWVKCGNRQMVVKRYGDGSYAMHPATI